MIDLYLKFASEDEAQSVLFADGKPNYANIDVLGVLYELHPVDAPEDYEPIPLEGWHVNVRVVDDEDAAALQPFSVVPTLPRRVWS